jgi:hypothetical protein
VSRRVLALALLHVGSLLSWAGYHELVWASAPTFRIPLQPRDPYDLMRGRYFVLNPLDSSIARGGVLSDGEIQRFLAGETSFRGPTMVGFCEVDGVYRVCALRRRDDEVSSVPRAEYWSRGFVTVSTFEDERKWDIDLDLGLRRFFIPNRVQLPAQENTPGWELEVSHRPGLQPLPRRLFFKGSPIDLR